MKKKGIIAAGLTLIMSLGLYSTCFAADAISAKEQEILDAIKTIELNGTTVNVPDKYIAQATQYLEKNDLTDAAVADVLAKYEDVKAAVKDTGAKSVVELKEVLKDTTVAAKVVDAVEATGKAAGVDTFEVTVDNSGKVDFNLEGTDGSTIKPNDSVIKDTGFGLAATSAVAVGALAVLGGCVAVARKNDLFA